MTKRALFIFNNFNIGSTFTPCIKVASSQANSSQPVGVPVVGRKRLLDPQKRLSRRLALPPLVP